MDAQNISLKLPTDQTQAASSSLSPDSAATEGRPTLSRRGSTARFTRQNSTISAAAGATPATLAAALNAEIMAKHGISASALQELREIFSLVDRDNGGTISPEDLKRLMNTLGHKTTQAELQVMVQEIDTNRDGEIDFEEFVAAMTRKVATTVPKERVLWAFRAIEVNSLRDRDLLIRLEVPLGAPVNPNIRQALTQNIYKGHHVTDDDLAGVHWYAKTRGCIPVKYLVEALTNMGTNKMSKEEAEDILEQIAPGLGPDDEFDYMRYVEVMFTNSY